MSAENRRIDQPRREARITNASESQATTDHG
jgi:hypothetical protein